MIEQIQEITPPTKTEPVLAAPTPPKKSNLVKVILLVVLGLIVMAGAVYAGMQIERKRVKLWTELPSTEPTPTEAPLTEIESQSPEITSVTPDETANWKTYSNTLHKYSIKIPKDWVVDDSKGVFIQIPGEVTFTLPAEMSISEVPFRTKMAIVATTQEKVRYSLASQQQYIDWLQKAVSSGEGERVFKTGDAKVGAVDAVEFVSRSYPGDATEAFYSVVTWFRKDGVNYYFELGGDEQKVKQLLPIYYQILSTFKFTQ